jgi:hypothetical protein
MTSAVLNIKTVIFLKINFKQLFTYGLFNDTFNSQDHVASNDHTISEQRIGKDVKGSSHGMM